jgi:hypothetical protein
MASMWTLIIKNDSGGDIMIEDMGIEIADTTQITFSNQFTYEEIATSDDLRGYVDDGTLVANNGTIDLTKSEGKEHLSVTHQFFNYGQDFWTKPCNFRVIDIVDDTGMGALSGMSFRDVCVNTTDDKYYQYITDVAAIAEIVDITCLAAAAIGNKYFTISTTTKDYHVWYNLDNAGVDPSPGSSTPIQVNIAAADDADAVATKTKTAMETKAFTITGPTTGTINITNNVAGDATDATVGDSGFTVVQDTDGVDSTNSWQEIMGVIELDRVIDLSDADESIFEFNDDVWEDQGDPGENLKTVGCLVADTRSSGREKFWTYSTELNIWRTNIQNTLNAAYHEGDEEDDHTIIADDGPVIIDSTGGDTAPINLTEHNTFPTTAIDGDIVNYGSELYVFDGDRGKWISGQKDVFMFGRRGSSKDQYLGFWGGQLASNNSGIRLPQNAIILSMTVQLDSSGTCDIHVRKNDSTTNIATLTCTAALGSKDVTLNVGVDADEYLQCFVEASAAVADPMVIVKVGYTN